MEITEDQYARIAPYLPVQRGNVSLSNLQVLNAILYVAEHGCKWRGLPARYGNWHTIYMRMNRWSEERGCSTGCSSSCNGNESCASSWKRCRWTAPSSRCIPMGRGR